MLKYFYYVADIITKQPWLKINSIYNSKITFNKFNYSYTYQKNINFLPYFMFQ